MNFELLQKAAQRVQNVPILVNMVSKRVRQLNVGFRPYVRRLYKDEENSDLVLREIAEGKLVAEMLFTSENQD